MSLFFDTLVGYSSKPRFLTISSINLCFCTKLYLDFRYIMSFGCIREMSNDLIRQ